MKIDDPIKKATGISVGAAPLRSGKAAEKTGVDKTPSDNVTLSPKAQALANQSAGAGVFDADKVNAIKAAIASGQFQINPERIADGLIDSVRYHLNAQRVRMNSHVRSCRYP